VGLSGEIRAVNRIEQRIAEAEKLGFKTVYLSKFNKLPSTNQKIKIIQVSKLDEMLSYLFG
jgi:DNA repair protein RadA/Sms